MTKTAKIEDITGVREWDGGQNGTVFYLSLLMDNGDKGSIGKKSKDALKIGDSLTYTIEENERGNKIKEIKENGYNGNGFNRGGLVKTDESSKFPSFALAYAKDVMCSMVKAGSLPDGAKSTDIAKATTGIADIYLNWLNEHKS